MDAELVEYELRRAHDPLRRPLRGYPGRLRARARRLPARPDPLRLYPPAVRRHDRALPGPGASAHDALSHRHRLGQRGDCSRLHEGRRHRLPAQEQPRPHRAGHRGRAGPGRSPGRRRRAPRRRSAAPRPTCGRSSTPASRPSSWWTATAPSRRSTPPPGNGPLRILGREASEGDRIHDFIPEGAASFQAALARRGPKPRALSPRHRRRRALVRDHPRAGRGRARHRHRRLPQRARRERAEAGRAGAARERGPLPRPVRQRERPGLHHHARRHLPLREPGLARGHGLLGRAVGRAALPGPGPSRQPGALSRRRGARRGGRADRTGRPRPGDRRRHAAHPRGQHQLHRQDGGRPGSAASTAT